jgi:hypothetical protein
MLHPHDLLVNIIIALTSSISDSGSPVGVNGILKKELGYQFLFSKFKEEYDVIFGDNFHPPDGFIRNTSKRISITVECKSYVDETNTALENQLKFYSEDEKFKKTFISENEKNEILIFCLEEELDKVVGIVKTLNLKTNLIVWSAKKTENDYFLVEKKYGNHTDKELNKRMEEGIKVLPPSTIFLVSPNIPIQRLTAEIGKRLLVAIGESSELKLKVDEFISKQGDITITDKKIKNAIGHLFRLVPEFGRLDSDIIIFKKNPRIDVIRDKIETIYNLKKEEFQICLKKGSVKVKEERIRKTKKRRAIQKGQSNLEF